MAYNDYQETHEGILPVEGDNITDSTPDEKLITIINSDMHACEDVFQELISIKRKNFDYWKGKQLDRSQLAVGEPEIVVNRVFVSIETMCAIVTSTTPDPWITVYPKTKKGLRAADKLQRLLRDIWEYHLNLQQIYESKLRSYYFSRIGLLKVGYDHVRKSWFVDLLDIESVRFDPKARSLDDSHFFAHYIQEPAYVVMQKYPKKAAAIKEKLAAKSLGDRSLITYLEYWADCFRNDKQSTVTIWKYEDIILDKEFDAYWNTGSINHHEFPKKPFIPLHSMGVGQSMIDETSQIEQAIPLQDSANERKRQIHRNAEMANGYWVGLAAAIGEDNFGKIGPKTNKILLDGDIDSVEGGLRIVTGQPFVSGVFEDMANSIAEIDNIFGTHDTTRGEKTSTETLGGQALRRDADRGRLDLTSRAYEQSAEDLYNWFVQLMYVFDMSSKKILSEKESEDPIEDYYRQKGYVPYDDNEDCLPQKELKKYKFKIVVKKGSTKPNDPVSMSQDAVMLLQTGAIDIQTAAEMMGLPNPRKIARRAYLERNDPAALFPELQGAQNIIEPDAVRHITDISSVVDAEVLEDVKQIVFGNVQDPQNITLEELQALKNHIATHDLYMKGIEVAEDLPEYDSLTEAQQKALRDHVAIELRILNDGEQALNMSGELPPEEPVEGELPPEEVDPAAMGLDAMMPEGTGLEGGGMPPEMMSAPSEEVIPA